ncbi:MAG: 4Fe-4S binding protein [Euryarchaeota archaeon]|nr:4Fe-4S binding protein [Euryarchaeota archaeon]
MLRNEDLRKIPIIVGVVGLVFVIINMAMGFLGDSGISKIEFFALLIALIFIGIGIFTFRENKLKKRRKVQLISAAMVNLAGLGIILKMLYAPFLHCYACPLSSTACPVGILQNFIIQGEIPYYFLGYTTVLFVLVGRAFCGWVCPFGLLQDIVDKIFNRKKKMVHQFRFTKFIVLAATIIAAWYFADTLFCKLCPVGFIEAAVPYRLEHGMIFDTVFIGRIIFFIGLMGIIFFISRFWCRNLCPFGAYAGIFNKVSFLHLDFNPEKCTECGKCREVCPQGLDPTKEQRSTDCILCGECVEACPTEALTLEFPTEMPKISPEPKEGAKEPKKELKKETEKRVNETPLRTYAPMKVYRGTDEIPYYDLPADAKKLKIKFYHLEEEIPPVLKEIKRFMNINFLPLEGSDFLEPTLMINNRIVPGTLTEENILRGIREEITMGNMLDIVFDLKKCRYCKMKHCGLDITGETGFKIEKLINYPNFSEIIASCTKNAVFISYGEPKIEEYNRKYLLKQKFSLNPLKAEILIEKDSKYCNRALTIFALLSYVTDGVVNFVPREYEEVKSEISFKIRSLPSAIVKDQRIYITTERGLVKSLQKL